jgi:hypothetical protein
MTPDSPTVPCERCGGAAEFATRVSALGNIPGARVYHCAVCNCLTWIELRDWSTTAATPAAPVPGTT